MALQRLLQDTFASVTTDKAILRYDSEGEYPEVGEAVWSIDEDGNEVKVEDGEYKTDDGVIVKVADGKVEEVVFPEEENPEETGENEEETSENLGADDTPTEDVTEEPVVDAEPIVEAVEEVIEQAVEEIVEEQTVTADARIEALEARIAALEERIKALENKPMGEPASDEFNAVVRHQKTGNKEIDRLTELFSK